MKIATRRNIVFGIVIAGVAVGELNACNSLLLCKRAGYISNMGYCLGSNISALGGFTAGVGGLYLANKAMNYVDRKMAEQQ